MCDILKYWLLVFVLTKIHFASCVLYMKSNILNFIFHSGLYRFRVGDVLQVTGFYNRAPQFKFICRRNVILSVDSDKTNEEDLHNSVTRAKEILENRN